MATAIQLLGGCCLNKVLRLSRSKQKPRFTMQGFYYHIFPIYFVLETPYIYCSLMFISHIFPIQETTAAPQSLQLHHVRDPEVLWPTLKRTMTRLLRAPERVSWLLPQILVEMIEMCFWGQDTHWFGFGSMPSPFWWVLCMGNIQWS